MLRCCEAPVMHGNGAIAPLGADIASDHATAGT
jgi:hypothetical protein